MSQSYEILESTPTTYMVDYEYEPHIIINDDRTITIPEELVHIAVRGDHNIETVTFDCPRYWDNHDLSAMKIQINYRRPDGRIDPYPVKNIRVDEVDDSQIHFDWTISGNVTEIKGNIYFTVCAKLSDTEGNRELEWHSRMSHGLIIDDSLDCSGEELAKQYPDVIESILLRLDNIIDGSFVTIKSVTESTVDGGSNIITFSDGTILSIKNGSKGDSGASSVYVGSGDMPEGCNVQIDPNGHPDEVLATREWVNNHVQEAIQNGADPVGTAERNVAEHNTSTDSHNDIRLIIDGLSNRLNALVNSSDDNLEKIAELVEYINANEDVIEGITTNKVNVSDITNNLTTNVANKPLSAAQGVVLKGLIDSLNTSLSEYQPKGDYALASAIPSKVSQLTNDKGYLTEHQDISGKVSVTDIINNLTTNVANKPLSAAQGVALKALIDAIAIPTKLSQLTNDTGYLTQHQSLSGYAKTSDIKEWALGQIQAAIDATWEASY